MYLAEDLSLSFEMTMGIKQKKPSLVKTAFNNLFSDYRLLPKMRSIDINRLMNVV